MARVRGRTLVAALLCGCAAEVHTHDGSGGTGGVETGPRALDEPCSWRPVYFLGDTSECGSCVADALYGHVPEATCEEACESPCAPLCQADVDFPECGP